MALGSEANKVVNTLLSIFIVAVLAVALLPIVLPYFRGATATVGTLNNATGGAYTTVFSATATVLVIGIVVGVILLAVKMFGGKRR